MLAKRTVNSGPQLDVLAFTLPSPRGLHDAFCASGIAVLRDVLDGGALCSVRREIGKLNSHGKRKDFLMRQTGFTPRRMNVLGGMAMNTSPRIMAAYRDPWFLQFLSETTGEKVVECPDRIENVIVTTLREPEDTHGWHIDDYPIAFILGVEMSPEAVGGYVELDRLGKTERVVLREGDAYILRSDRIRHRVAPLREKSRRVILNFTYSFEGLEIIPNGTAPLVCG